MTSYLVTWKIDIETDDPLDAALEALLLQRHPEGPTHFTVESDDHSAIEVDLNEFHTDLPGLVERHLAFFGR